MSLMRSKAAGEPAAFSSSHIGVPTYVVKIRRTVAQQPHTEVCGGRPGRMSCRRRLRQGEHMHHSVASSLPLVGEEAQPRQPRRASESSLNETLQSGGRAGGCIVMQSPDSRISGAVRRDMSRSAVAAGTAVAAAQMTVRGADAGSSSPAVSRCSSRERCRRAADGRGGSTA